MTPAYFYIIIIFFIAVGLIFFIRNAKKMTKKYFSLTLALGLLSALCFVTGFINFTFGLSGMFFAYIGVFFYVVFLIKSMLYPVKKQP